jgi:hypothetical protein
MSTQTPHVPSTVGTELQEIKIVSHSNLFYWWPLWAVGFVMALLTWMDGSLMAIVPPGTEALRNARVEGERQPGQKVIYERTDALVVPQGKHLHPENVDLPPVQPYLHIARNKSYGVLYAVVLILCIVITNVPLRGLWSVVVIVLVVLLSIIFALATFEGRTYWDHILDTLFRMHIHINALGYVLISAALFVIWLVTFLFFDPQIYMVFTPGQLRVRQEIGGGEAAYDTAGMVIQKQRNDLFRHWILGLGSGDLIVNTSGATAHHFDLPNVLFVGYKVRQIENMLREKPIVQGQGYSAPDKR